VGIQIEKTGFRIKSGMTKCVESFLRNLAGLDKFLYHQEGVTLRGVKLKFFLPFYVEIALAFC